MVGTEVLLLPSVAVLAWDRQERLLLVRDAGINQWVTVGGMVEPGETPQGAAVREAYEETGLEVADLRLRGVVGGPDYFITYPNGDQVAYVTTVFDARVTGGRARADGPETSELGWWSPARLERNLEISSLTRSLLFEIGALPAVSK